MQGVFFIHFMTKYKDFLGQFKNAVNSANRDISQIELIAVSKTKSSKEIMKVIDQNHLSFGENKIQEVDEKWSEIKKTKPSTRLHFIGSIQSRKTSAIHESCDVIHSLDRIKIVRKFNDIEKLTNLKREYFIQINTGNEPQKSGVLLPDADQFINECLINFEINIIGLMCIPPSNEKPSKHFKELKALSTNFNLDCLSMGMSGDYEEAIKCGSTHIRIGTNIFGPRH